MSIVYERIFTNSEIQVLEAHINYLVKQIREMKAYCKEEFKKIQLRLEKEIMDAQQQNKHDVAKVCVIIREPVLAIKF